MAKINYNTFKKAIIKLNDFKNIIWYEGSKVVADTSWLFGKAFDNKLFVKNSEDEAIKALYNYFNSANDSEKTIELIIKLSKFPKNKFKQTIDNFLINKA